MIQKYFFIVNYLLVILVASFYFYKIKESKPLKLFFGFLVYSLFTEIGGAYYKFVLFKGPYYVYNLWVLIAFLFYSYFFLNYVKSKGKQLVIKLFAALIFGLFVVNALFFQDVFSQVFQYNNMLGKILMSVIIVLYFADIMQSDRLLYFKKSMPFWIALGVFIYSLGSIPVFVVGETIGYSTSWLFSYIFYILNFAMGVSFITGFIVSKEKFNT